jgi:hypothetical protein
MHDKNWQQMTPAERRQRFAQFNESNTSPGILAIILKMCERGSGHGSAIEAVRQQQADPGAERQR